MLDRITIYTDGGARGNGKEGNLGAWAYQIKTKIKERCKSSDSREKGKNRP